MIVVGLTGFARSGKDTLADHLVAQHGFVKMSFADPLKEMALTLDPYIGITYDGAPIRMSEALADAGGNEGIVKQKYPEYRRVLQRLGTDCLRSADENFWVGRMAAKLGKLDYDAKVVIPDMRFDNESQLVWDGHVPNATGTPITNHYYEGFTFRVDRQAVEPKYGHVSEMNVKFISVHDSISNNGSIAEFLERADELLEEWSVLPLVERGSR